MVSVSPAPARQIFHPPLPHALVQSRVRISYIVVVYSVGVCVCVYNNVVYIMYIYYLCGGGGTQPQPDKEHSGGGGGGPGGGGGRRIGRIDKLPARRAALSLRSRSAGEGRREDE